MTATENIGETSEPAKNSEDVEQTAQETGEAKAKPLSSNEDPENKENTGKSSEPSLTETLKAENDTLRLKLKEAEEKLLREAAEYENFKRRIRQDTDNKLKFASLSLGEGFISSLDDLERALGHANKSKENISADKIDEFIKGIEMIYQQLLKNLEDNNYKKIEAKGLKFDPEKHEAIGMIETVEIEDGHVAEVFKEGYTLHDRVIRPAMVQVAKNSGNKEE